MRPKGLSKYDAPLRIQYQWGYDAFKRGGRFVTKNGKQMFQELYHSVSPSFRLSFSISLGRCSLLWSCARVLARSFARGFVAHCSLLVEL